MAGRILDREEYIEQAYFFRTYRQRLAESVPSQELLIDLQEEILATTKLPMALDLLAAEIKHTGRLSDGMAHLGHYFSAFQAFIMSKAEAERSKFDVTIALEILERLARYMADGPTPAGLFVYQFECLARNRLGYDRGLEAVAADPLYDDDWRTWLTRVRQQLGNAEFSELVYYRSEYYVQQQQRHRADPAWRPDFAVLFGLQEGRIARANRGKDPLYMFAALQRQLDYPAVPRTESRSGEPAMHPALRERFKRIEQRLKILELEQQGKFDISQFYKGNPAQPDFTRLDDDFEKPTDPSA
jgi:hypothetical protein